jgi:hypothetical protein
MIVFSNKRHASLDKSSNKKNPSFKPEKTESIQLPEIVFSIGNWNLLIQATNDKETRFLYRNHNDGINRFSSPYEDFVKSGHSFLNFNKILYNEGPDKAIDYVLTIIITYMLFVYAHQAGRIISIYDIIKFDALGYGHGGSVISNEPGGKASVNSKAMPDCVVQATPSGLISLTTQTPHVYELLMNQQGSNEHLSRSAKLQLRQKISEEYSKCVPYYHEKTSQLEANITTLAGMLNDSNNDITMAEDVLMRWFSDKSDLSDWAHFKIKMKEPGSSQDDYRKNIVKGAIGFLGRKKRVYDKKQKDCIKGAELSSTESLKYHPVVTEEDKKAMATQIQGLGSCPILKANVLLKPKIDINEPRLSEEINPMLEEIQRVISPNISVGNSTSLAFDKSHANDLLYTTGHTINESGFPVRFIRKLAKAFGLSFKLSSLEYSNNLSNGELNVGSIFSKLLPFKIDKYYPICCNPIEKKGIEKHDSQTPGGRKKTRKQRRHTPKRRASVSSRNGPRRPFYRVR